MVSMEAIEQNKEGKESLAVCEYRRRDYIGLNMIFTFIFSVFAFGIALLLFFLCKMEYIFDNFDISLITGGGIAVIMLYFLFLIVCEIVTYKIASDRYQEATRMSSRYQKCLKKLADSYKAKE